ncbi:MAG: hypothetical protein IPM97_00875 [Bdellovibrionaceae bacterium]|nr:hypothetical protein [Pseudobdellovibrionaceae bacterium]
MKNENKQTFLGMPMNWNSKMIFKTLWNNEDDRLFPPKAFGIGWTVNFHAVGRKIGLIKIEKTKK